MGLLNSGTLRRSRSILHLHRRVIRDILNNLSKLNNLNTRNSPKLRNSPKPMFHCRIIHIHRRVIRDIPTQDLSNPLTLNRLSLDILSNPNHSLMLNLFSRKHLQLNQIPSFCNSSSNSSVLPWIPASHNLLSNHQPPIEHFMSNGIFFM